MSDLDIAEVARRSGLPASTLRFYEEKGLIASTGRRGLRRLFAPDVLERLALIALGQSAGFALDELRVILAPTAHRQSDGQSQSDGRSSPRGSPSPTGSPRRTGGPGALTDLGSTVSCWRLRPTSWTGPSCA